MADARKQNEASQSAIDWQAFFAEANVPIIGYDAVNDHYLDVDFGNAQERGTA